MNGITLAQQWSLYMLCATHYEGLDGQGQAAFSKSQFRADVESAASQPGADLTTAFWDTAKNLDANIKPAPRPAVNGLDGPNLRAALEIPYTGQQKPCPSAAQSQIHSHVTAAPAFTPTNG